MGMRGATPQRRSPAGERLAATLAGFGRRTASRGLRFARCNVAVPRSRAPASGQRDASLPSQIGFGTTLDRVVIASGVFVQTLILVVAATIAGTATAAPQKLSPSDARAARAEGEALFAQGDFLAALAKFQIAWVLDRAPVDLLQIGLCRYKLGESA